MTCNVPQPLRDRLNAAVDYSPEFTRRVSELGTLLRRNCNAEVTHRSNMDYSAGQVLWLTTNLVADHQLRVYISSRGPLFAIRQFEQIARAWHEISQPTRIDDGGLADCTRRILQEAGLAEVSKAEWSLPVDDRRTDLDGAPATVFDVLFSELI
jgi:hypothetical protein